MEPMNCGKIAEALAKAQSEIIQPEKNKKVSVPTKNGGKYSFEYADYNAIVGAVRGPLSKNSICFIHFLTESPSGMTLWTRLVHSSGEYFESAYPIPRLSDQKDIGGAITYGKRYCLSALTGCVADDDVDADPKNTEEFTDKKTVAKPTDKTAIGPSVSSVSPSQPAQTEEKPNAFSAADAAKLGQERAEALRKAIKSNPKWNDTTARNYMMKHYKTTQLGSYSEFQFSALMAVIKDGQPAVRQPGQEG